jgi:transcriptional regulator with XRE-family HTH domain
MSKFEITIDKADDLILAMTRLAEAFENQKTSIPEVGVIARIKDLCANKDSSLAKLERELAFGNGTIRNWDKNSPSVDKLQKVANYFMVSTDYLLGRDAIETTVDTDTPEEETRIFPEPPKETEEPDKEEETSITDVQIRAVLTAKNKSGKKDAIQELLKRYGTVNLTKLDPAKYVDFLKEAKEL